MSCPCLGLQFYLKKYGMLITWVFECCYSSIGVQQHVYWFDYVVFSHFHCRSIQYQIRLHHLCWHLLTRFCYRHSHYPAIQFELALADVFTFVSEPPLKVWLSFLPTNLVWMLYGFYGPSSQSRTAPCTSWSPMRSSPWDCCSYMFDYIQFHPLCT
jgi:hypothetical protein